MRFHSSFNRKIIPLAFLCFLPFQANAQADHIVFDRLGEDICRLGYRPLEAFEAEIYKDDLIRRMGSWQITGLAGSWAITGSGYNGVIKNQGAVNETFCYPENNIDTVDGEGPFERALSVKRYIQNGVSVLLDSEKDISFLDPNSLADGVYLVDKGHGWVRGEEDFIKKGYSDDDNYVTIKTSKSTYSSHFVKLAGGIGIANKTIEAIIKQSFGQEWQSSKTTTVSYRFSGDEGKQLYVRVYVTYQRFDTVEVKNKRIVSHHTSYIPTGSFGKRYSYIQGESFDESRFLENHGERRVTDSDGFSRSANQTISLNDDNLNQSSFYDIENNVEVKSFAQAGNGINQEEVISIARLDDQGNFVEENLGSEILESRSYIADGYYAIDYGEHWVRKDDDGVAYTMVVPENTVGSYAQTASASTTWQSETSLSGKISLGLLRVVLEASYGAKWGESLTETLDVSITSKPEENTYAKIYPVNRRIDVVEFSSGDIVARTSTFKPDEFKAIGTRYTKGTSLNQAEAYFRDSQKILGNIEETDVGGLVSQNINTITHSLGVLDKRGSPTKTPENSLNTQIKDYDIVVQFSVPEDGAYELGYFSEVIAQSGIEFYKVYGWNADYEIWQLNPDDHDFGVIINKRTLNSREFISHRDWLKPNDFEYVIGADKQNHMPQVKLEENKVYVLVLRNFSYKSDARVWTNIALSKSMNLYSSDYKTVHFQTNGGSVVPAQKILKGSTIFDSPNSYKQGYHFDGWYIDSNFSRKFRFGSEKIMKDGESTQYLYAKWVKVS